MNILDFTQYKQSCRRISVVTCYDYTSALILADSAVDAVLVGDSGAMTMMGYDTTLGADVATMAAMTKSVANGLKINGAKSQKFLIADMPFLSFRKGLAPAVEAAGQLMQAGANAIKIEGAIGNLKLIAHLVQSGVPVMGHLGLMPQSVHAFGGFKVQGRSESAQAQLKSDALDLQEAGCFAIVLECVPHPLAETLSQSLTIPTIGIGAGAQTDGQVLVWQDLLGLNKHFRPKFVRAYLDGAGLIGEALNQFHNDVGMASFPSASESFE